MRSWNVDSEKELPFILAVEDHPIEQRLLQLLSRSLGFQITIVDSGRAALEQLARSAQYRIVLMDWWLPDVEGESMDGLECTRRLRKQELGSDRHTVVVGLTAHAMLGDRQKCIDAGMDDYLSKPYTSEQFKNKLAKWIKHGEDAKTAV